VLLCCAALGECPELAACIYRGRELAFKDYNEIQRILGGWRRRRLRAYGLTTYCQGENNLLLCMDKQMSGCVDI